jgi:3,4-dihydroxy-2-butanone 4-phosphate synthase
MMRGAAIAAFAAQHSMPMLSIADIVAWRAR